MKLSICIIDEDSLRAETIKETLLDEDYKVASFTSRDFGLKALVENSFDVVFVDPALTSPQSDIINKIKSLSPGSHIVALINSASADIIIQLSEYGVAHYIETPINSINAILQEMASIEADIMKEEDRHLLIVSILEDSKALAKGHIKTDSEHARSLLKKITLASNLLSPSVNAPGEIKGRLEDVRYYDVIRIASGIYKEGIFQAVRKNERATFILKNSAVVSAIITPNVKGLKAFYRMCQWKDGEFSFRNRISVSYNIDPDISAIDILKLCSNAKRISGWYSARANNLPPKDLLLGVDKNLIKRDVNLTPDEIEVLASVIEYKKVKEVLDYNRLPDYQIFDILISLRKKGAIEVSSR